MPKTVAQKPKSKTKKSKAIGLTEIIFILDKSGSMEHLKGDVIGGFNQFVEDQKKVKGECRMTLTLFDTNYDITIKGEDIKDVKPLTEETYRPGGMTALLDAVGRTIDEVKKRTGKKPDKTILAIMTDGAENSSHEYTKEQIVNRVKEQEKEGWDFAFLGAGIDAFSDKGGAGLGFRSANLMTTDQSSAGYHAHYTALNQAVTRSRTTGKSLNLADSDKKVKAKK